MESNKSPTGFEPKTFQFFNWQAGTITVTLQQLPYLQPHKEVIACYRVAKCSLHIFNVGQFSKFLSFEQMDVFTTHILIQQKQNGANILT